MCEQIQLTVLAKCNEIKYVGLTANVKNNRQHYASNDG